LRRRGVDFWPFADIAVTYIPLGHALGRLGCFLNGCCYGERSEVPWAIPFRRVPMDLSQTPVGSPVYIDHCKRFGLSYWDDAWSFPVHPTQLYSLLGLMSIFALLYLLRRKWHPFTGFVLPLYMVLYGIMRFIVEFYRGDHNPTHFGGVLSDQQVFSVLIVVLGVVFYIYLAKTRRPSDDSAEAESS
jgi:phosphatidylglycerol:prolipoprotein diacylglycerol transferase